MYRSKILSNIELDAIDLYNTFPTKSVEIIAKELQCPVWYIQNCIFKYLNGQVKDGKYCTHKKLITRHQPRKSLVPTKVALEIAKEQTKQSGLKLRTII